MDRTEHLLTCLSEECGEVSKEVSKSLRFGLDDKLTLDPEGPRGTKGPTNREKIAEEFADLLGIYQMAIREGIFPEIGLYRLTPDIQDKMRAKAKKVEAFMGYAERVGTLKPSEKLQVAAPPPTAKQEFEEALKSGEKIRIVAPNFPAFQNFCDEQGVKRGHLRFVYVSNGWLVRGIGQATIFVLPGAEDFTIVHDLRISGHKIVELRLEPPVPDQSSGNASPAGNHDEDCAKMAVAGHIKDETFDAMVDRAMASQPSPQMSRREVANVFDAVTAMPNRFSDYMVQLEITGFKERAEWIRSILASGENLSYGSNRERPPLKIHGDILTNIKGENCAWIHRLDDSRSVWELFEGMNPACKILGIVRETPENLSPWQSEIYGPAYFREGHGTDENGRTRVERELNSRVEGTLLE